MGWTLQRAKIWLRANRYLDYKIFPERNYTWFRQHEPQQGEKYRILKKPGGLRFKIGIIGRKSHTHSIGFPISQS